MKKIISVLTASRSEYGLLKPVINQLKQVDVFDVRIAVTGAHLSPEFGLTYQEILDDGNAIDEKVEILLSADTPSSISKSMGLAMIGFADYFRKLHPDLLVVLGDRYETLAVAAAAMNERIPIAHIHGGETTEGAVDESIRHAITKLSYLHFTSTEAYRKRVIQLGEEPSRVYCVGAPGIDNIKNVALMNKEELAESIGFALDQPYAMVSYHPVTLEDRSSGVQMKALLDACDSFGELSFVFTKANADTDGRVINEMIDAFAKNNDRAVAFTSLGMKRYLSALKYCALVIGNSSSGLVEAPSFGVPTVNIGDRQKGRIQADSVINCEPNEKAIRKAIEIALSEHFRTIAEQTINPYGDGNSSIKITEKIMDYLLNHKINLKKQFYDLP
ncbi:MAG: UDP-N-acetylglucosamine 2-epimerase [Bacillota bacterium]|nr:UDP-N-acetylglucosamine 2-epimerase [Bacillota bacterium]